MGDVRKIWEPRVQIPSVRPILDSELYHLNPVASHSKVPRVLASLNAMNPARSVDVWSHYLCHDLTDDVILI
jgi:hypothetical protein